MRPAPNSLAAKDLAYTVHPFTDLARHAEQGPLIITRGEGIHVFDDDGNRYMEAMAGLWCVSLGYSEKRLVDAATRQLSTLPYNHIFTHRSTVPVIELAEKLIGIAPKPLARAFFANSGSEAVDSAIKLVWYYNNALGRPDKKVIIARRRAYHGVTVAGGSLTGLPMVHDDFDLPLARFRHTTTPYPYREQKDGESEAAFSARLARELEELILEIGPDQVAAFIAEPVMGAGGVIVPPEGYFQEVQAVLRRHDVLMIADEVICGFGRTGSMWGSETYGITPDILTCAKQLSSAYIPISAVLITEGIYRAIAEQSHRRGTFGTGFTYGGHPVAAAVALETLRIYEERDTIGHVREVAPRFQARLRALAGHPLVGEARGVGLVGALELVQDKAGRASFPLALKAAPQVVAKAMAHGLIVRALPGDIVAICPPLIISEAEIDDLFDRLGRALDEALPGLRAAA
jgi:4-aminobutyrate---pyruvate transaminase